MITPTKIFDSTKLSDFMRCQRYAFWRHVMHLAPSRGNYDLQFGSAVHDGMRTLRLTNWDVDAACAAFQQTFDLFAIDLDDIKEPKTPDKAYEMFEFYTQTYKTNDPYEILFTETANRVLVAPDQAIVVKIDVIARDKRDGKVYCIDYKTAKARYQHYRESFEHRRQTGAYIHFLHSAFPEDQVGGFVIDAMFFQKQPQCERYVYTKSYPQLLGWLDTTNNYINAWKGQEELLINSFDFYAKQDHLPLFVKNEERCYDYNKRCPYHALCFSGLGGSPYNFNPLSLVGQEQILLGFTKAAWDPTASDGGTNIDHVWEKETGFVSAVEIMKEHSSLPEHMTESKQ